MAGIKERIGAKDAVAIKKTVGLQTAYMILEDYENAVPNRLTQVFPNEDTAKAYSRGKELVKVEIIRKFE